MIWAEVGHDCDKILPNFDLDSQEHEIGYSLSSEIVYRRRQFESQDGVYHGVPAKADATLSSTSIVDSLSVSSSEIILLGRGPRSVMR